MSKLFAALSTFKRSTLFTLIIWMGQQNYF